MKQDALAFLQYGTSVKDVLAESFAPMIENVMKKTLSSKLKNTEGSGTPVQGGSMVFTRMSNSLSNPYGTARLALAGADLEFSKVTLYIDTDREIVNEAENKDLRLYTISELIAKKRVSNEKSMIRELERAFFQVTVDGGSKFTPSDLATTVALEIEELIVDVETTENDFVDGVDRDSLAVVTSVAEYSSLRNYIDTGITNASINVGDELINYFHGVQIYSNLFLPAGVDAICMAIGSTAQQVVINDYDANKVPFGNAWSIELYYSYGTVAVMPDLIKYIGSYVSPSN